MKFLTTPQIAVIEAKDGAEMQSLFNEKMKTLVQEGKKVQYTFPNGLPFVAYITYEENERIPETIEDEYWLKGIRFYCNDCPCFQRPTDGRRKYGSCPYKDVSVCGGDNACEGFYKRITTGEWEPRRWEIER